MDSSVTTANLRVLFISGPEGGTRRYRCFQQQEQLELQGISTGFRTFGDLRLLQDALDYDVFIFHRTPYHRLLQDVLDLAHRRGKIALFETDDLIFEPDLVQYDGYYRHLATDEAQEYRRDVHLSLETLKACDSALTTTDYLSQALQKRGKHVIINRNAVSVEFMRRAEAAYHMVEPPSDRIIIGYISGSPSHDQDFAVAADALCQVLDKYPRVNLRTVGPLALSERFAVFGERIQQIPSISWENVPYEIRSTHINIAPLDLDNPFCQSKSELKYFEAGFLGVPTIASPTEAFRFAIRHGDTGLLASNVQEWFTCLDLLIRNPARRTEIGQAARRDALQNYTPQVRGQQFIQTLRTLVAHHRPLPGAPQSQAQLDRRLLDQLSHYVDQREGLGPFVRDQVGHAALSSQSFDPGLASLLQTLRRVRRSPREKVITQTKHLAKKLAGPAYDITVAGETCQLIGELTGGQVYRQTFRAELPNLCGVRVMFATFGRINTPDVIFRLKESFNSPQDIATCVVSACLLRDIDFFTFPFDPLPDSEGKILCFSVESPEAVLGDAVGLWRSIRASPNAFYKNSEPSAEQLAYLLQYKHSDPNGRD